MHLRYPFLLQLQAVNGCTNSSPFIFNLENREELDTNVIYTVSHKKHANVTRQTEIEKSSRNLAQHIVSSFRSKRLVTYKAKANGKFQKAKTVGLAVTLYQAKGPDMM